MYKRSSMKCTTTKYTQCFVFVIEFVCSHLACFADNMSWDPRYTNTNIYTNGWATGSSAGRAWETEFNPLRELGKIATVCWAPGQPGVFRGGQMKRQIHPPPSGFSHDRNFTLAYITWSHCLPTMELLSSIHYFTQLLLRTTGNVWFLGLI